MTISPADSQLMEAVHYIGVGKYSQARDILAEILEGNPEDGYAFYLSAVCATHLGAPEEAIAACQESLRCGYTPEEVHSFLGQIYMFLPDYFQAEEHLLACLRLNPQRASALAQYAFVMFHAGFLEKSAELMREARAIDPEDTEILRLKHLIAMLEPDKHKKYDTLIDLIGQGDASEYEKLIRLGNFYSERKEYRQAKEYFRQAFLLDPTDEKLADILYELDKQTSPWLIPRQIIQKANPFVIWGVFLDLIFLFPRIGWDSVTIPVTVVYLLIVVYSWTIDFIYDIFHGRRKKIKRGGDDNRTGRYDERTPRQKSKARRYLVLAWS